ncbi:hypothetical protein ACFL28_02770 [Candidatus Omnitrophota bacterium]
MNLFILIGGPVLLLVVFLGRKIFLKDIKDSKDGVPPDDIYPLW